MRMLILLIMILSFAGCEKSESLDLKPEISKADSVYAAKFINDKILTEKGGKK